MLFPLCPSQRLLRMFAAVLMCCAFAACTQLPFYGSSAPSLPVVQEARNAWQAENMPLALKLYKKIVATKGITQAEYREAYSRYAIATAKTGKAVESLAILKRWQGQDPSANTLPEWQDAWFLCTRELSPSRAIANAKTLWLTKKSPDTLRMQAAFILIGRSFSTAQCKQAFPLLSALYGQQNAARRAVLEQHLLMETRYISSSTLQDLMAQIPAGREKVFPYSIIIVEQARRLAPSNAAESSRLLGLVRGAFADKTLPESALKAGQENAICVVLALPNSGSIAPIANKISNGASIARQELGQSGKQVQLEIINSDAPDWLSRLDALPPHCVVVGGPLRANKMNELKKGNTLHQRAIFSFLSELEGDDEGKTAWRFFPSNRDQINALLRLTYDAMGLRSFAAFYPEDGYGSHMTGILETALSGRGARFAKQSYEPQASITWADSAAKLLQKPDGMSAHIDAIFLPDSWKNMDALNKSFSYYGANTMVMMGTALWEQSLADKFVAQADTYALAVFPAAWNPKQLPAALSASGNTDFWKCLGYDFVRFAAGMKLNTMRNGAVAVNNSARNAQNMTWTLAPMQWDAFGKASQALYLFTPSAQGMALLNPDAFALQRKARLEGAAAQPASGEAAAATLPQGEQTAPVPAPLPTTPRPSHKLFLPGM